jgi:hypothetical protein
MRPSLNFAHAAADFRTLSLQPAAMQLDGDAVAAPEGYVLHYHVQRLLSKLTSWTRALPNYVPDASHS